MADTGHRKICYCREKDGLTGLGSEDERGVAVVVGEVWIDVVGDSGEKVEYWHKAAGTGVAQARLQHSTYRHSRNQTVSYTYSPSGKLRGERWKNCGKIAGKLR